MINLLSIGVGARSCDTIILPIMCVMNYEFAAYASWFVQDMATMRHPSS